MLGELRWLRPLCQPREPPGAGPGGAGLGRDLQPWCLKLSSKASAGPGAALSWEPASSPALLLVCVPLDHSTCSRSNQLVGEKRGRSWQLLPVNSQSLTRLLAAQGRAQIGEGLALEEETLVWWDGTCPMGAARWDV